MTHALTTPTGGRRSTRTTLTLAVGVLALVIGAGWAWTALRSPTLPASDWPSGPLARDPDSTVYTAPSGILFDHDSAALNPEAAPLLRAILAEVETAGLRGTIRVEGYTDDVGSEQYNLELALARASTVARWLVDQGHLDRARIQVIPVGEALPAMPNDTERNRRANRRVIIAVQRGTPMPQPSPSR